MSLRTEFEHSGSWLFRHRSYLPVLSLPLFIGGILTFSYLGSNHESEELWNLLCLVISFAGLVVRIVTIGYAPKGTSGRNTSKQVADVLSTTGMYSLVRHPLYLGNYLIVLGLISFFHSAWLILSATCVYALYYERIMFAEEAFLRERFGATFEAWAEQTPAIIPKFHGWVAPSIPFCWRTVLRREYTGLFGIIATATALEIILDSVAEHRLRIDWPWIGLLASGGAIYLTLRTLKKTTALLHVKGR